MNYRKQFLLIVFLFLVLSLTYFYHQKNEKQDYPLCKNCNVVLITIDCLRADHLGAYGYPRNTSPNIDAFAQESIVFENAITAWPKTVPALGSILTGNFGHTTHMMYGIFDPLLPESKTLSEYLSEYGYISGAFMTNGNVAISKGWAQGFHRYEEMWKTENDTRADNVNNYAIEFMNENRDWAFFSWIHYIDPHSKYIARDEDLRYLFLNDSYYDKIFYDDDQTKILPIQFGKNYTWRNFGKNGIPDIVNDLGHWETAYYIAEYDAEIRYTDRYVGKILEYLKENNLYDNSIIIIMADHGEALGGNDWYFDHGRFTYDDCSRVPLMIRIPGQKPHRVQHPVSSNDILPTILDLVGVEKGVTDGESLVDVITGKKPYVQKYVYNEGGYNRDYQRTIRDERYKLIYIPAPEARANMRGELFELYDIVEDPLEQKNIVYEKPDEFNRLRTELFKWMLETMPPLRRYHTYENISRIYTVDFIFPDIEVENFNFYTKIQTTNRDQGHCFTLAVPDPDATIVIELLEANNIEQPLYISKKLWDDPDLNNECVNDDWGCIKINGETITEIPYSIKMSEIQNMDFPHHISLQTLDNNKTFCFKSAQFNKRTEESNLGYVVEIMGHVIPSEKLYSEVDEQTLENLRTLGYIG